MTRKRGVTSKLRKPGKASKVFGMTRIQKTWFNRVEGAIAFLEELEKLPAKNKDAWVKGQLRHFRLVAEDLLKNAPPGMSKHKRAFVKRLAKC